MTYMSELEIYQVSQRKMYDSFILAFNSKIRDKVRGLFKDDIDSQNTFEELLREEFLDEDSKIITKRLFLEWIEQRPRKQMASKELLEEYEKRFLNFLLQRGSC